MLFVWQVGWDVQNMLFNTNLVYQLDSYFLLSWDTYGICFRDSL